MLVEAYNIVHKKHPDWILDIYGEVQKATRISPVAGDFGIMNWLHLILVSVTRQPL